MGANITVEAKPIYVKILTRQATEAATRLVPN